MKMKHMIKDQTIMESIEVEKREKSMIKTYFSKEMVSKMIQMMIFGKMMISGIVTVNWKSYLNLRNQVYNKIKKEMKRRKRERKMYKIKKMGLIYKVQLNKI